jgi:hypothetical protein
MTWLAASDPLALLAIQAGQVQNPTRQDGAVGGGSLCTDQRAISIGEPVPIVFARRRDNAGGILISPGATEARFENDTSNNVTAFYLLPLSEGRMDSIQVRDVFQCACRVGTFTQTYNRRAGTWQPGNFIVDREGFDKPEASYICGSIGSYPDISTLSFRVTIPNGFDQWRSQVHFFIRGGMYVTRLTDNLFGPSDNFSDLVRWLLLNSGRVPSALLDTTAFSSAAQFLEANQFRCNIWIQEAENFGDFIAKLSPYFLLGESNNGGKKGLRPLLPVNNNGTINTSAINWSYIFTENEILPNTLEIDYSNYADRQPFVAQMIWRQELGDDAAIIRTAEVRYINTAEVGPYESYDLSGFCTTEAHAVKVGAYILSRRRFVSHTVRFAARPQAHNRLLSPGSIIRIRLGRNGSGGGASEHDYLYQVERIGKTLAGDVSYECSHFPIDSQGRSIIALNVANATGTGILLTSNSTGVGCDINSATDNTIPVESFIVPGSEFDIGGFDTGTIVATGAGAGIGIDDLGIPDGSNLGVSDLGSGFGGGSGSTGGGIDSGGGGSPTNPPDDFPQPIEDGPFIPPPNPEENPTPFDPTQPLAPGGPNTPITIPPKPSPSDPNVAQVRVFRVEVAFKSASSMTSCTNGSNISNEGETLFSFKLTGVAISVSGNFAQTSSGCGTSSQSPVPGINWVVVNADGSTTTGATSTFSIFTFTNNTGSVTGVQYVTGIFDETNNNVPEFLALGLPPVYLEQLETQRPLL